MWLKAIIPISGVQQAELCISKTKTRHTKSMISDDEMKSLVYNNVQYDVHDHKSSNNTLSTFCT